MKLHMPRSAVAALIAALGMTTYAIAAGNWSTLPVVGNPAFCGAIVGSSNVQSGTTGQGTGTTTGSNGVYCAQTIPAGPASLTGSELIPADTVQAGGAPPQTVTIPSGLLSAYGTNVLVGADFGQNLWQRGTTPLSAGTPASAAMTADGWYAFSYAAGSPNAVTVSKQTGASDVPTSITGTLASARIQRVLSSPATSTAPIVFGQLVPNDGSDRFPGNNAVLSCYMLAGANFSPSGGNVTLTIAYHSAADTTSEATNAQGTNTATFASSLGSTQNITNYIEAVNTVVPVTTAWTRYSTAAAIPTLIPNTTTPVTGVGVKISYTPVGVAGAADWLEVANCQLESRPGTSVGPSAFNRRNLAEEYSLETARYYQITEAGAGTPFYAVGYVPSTNIAEAMIQFPTLMRITPVTSPITTGGFKFLLAGTATAPGTLVTTGTTNTTPRTAGIGSSGMASGTAGQATILTGNAGTGVLGFSAEP